MRRHHWPQPRAPAHSLGGLVALLALLAPGPAAAQRFLPRSQEYLFITGVDDARAVWVNPAGLGWLPEASLMGEAVADRSGSDWRLAQYTVGLNTRGLALAYQRERTDSVSFGVLRVGLGLPLGQGAIGAAASFYRGTGERGVDLGLRYPVFPGLDVGAVVRNLGRPLVAGQIEPLAAAAGASWTVAREAALGAEAVAVERLGASGYELSYRGGIVLHATWPAPLALHALAHVAGDGSVRRWSVGLMLGRLDQLGAVAGAIPQRGLGTPERVSLVGLATRRPPGLAP